MSNLLQSWSKKSTFSGSPQGVASQAQAPDGPLNDSNPENVSQLRTVIGAQTHLPQSAKREISYDNFLQITNKPVTYPQENILFSDLIKKSKTDGAHNYYHPDIEFSYKFEGPDVQSVAIAETAQRPGFVPLSTAFHVQSHRERLDEDDDGLDDADLTAADGIVRKKNANANTTEERRASKRHSFIYEAIRMVKGDFVFPHRTYRPKVQVAFRVPPGSMPQAVVIERLHRIYKKSDINAICLNLSITPFDLMAVPHYGETSERFYQEMQWRNRIRINGVDKRDFLKQYLKARVGSESKSGEGASGNSDELIDEKKKTESQQSATFGGNKPPEVVDDEEETVPRRRPPKYEEEGEGYDGQDGGDDQSSESSDTNPLETQPPFGAMFPLDYFDNEEYDIRSGAEWMFLGWDWKDQKMYPIPAKCYLPMRKNLEKKKKKCKDQKVVDDEPDAYKAISELTSTNLLQKTERLEKFRHWLLGERYRRLKKLGNVQAKPNPDDKELTAFARATTTVANFMDMHRDNDSVNDADVDSTTQVSARDSTASIMSVKNLFQQEAEGSNDSLFMIGDVSQGSDFLSQFRRAEKPKGEDMDNEKNQKPTVSEVKRSESLLSDDFSDPCSAPGSPDMTEVKPSVVRRKSTELQEDNETGNAQVLFSDQANEDLGRPSGISDIYLEPNYPSSPDVDPYEDGYEDLVFDYDKMKRVHNYDWRWVEVAVFKYDEDTRKYFVRTIFPPLVFAWVSKLYLLMDGEDPYRHAERIQDAILRRYEVENLMRYNLYVDCLPMERRAKSMPASFMRTILTKVLDAPKLVCSDHVLKRVQREIDLEYQRTHLMLEFNSIVEKHPKLYQPWVQIPKPFITWGQGNEWKKLQSRQMDLGNFSYKKTRIQKMSVIYKQEAYEGLVEIVSVCMKAREKSLILHRRNFSTPLDEFEKQQQENIAQVMDYLRDDWTETILAAIRTNLSKIPHSWYNIKETRWDVYLMSKTSNYLTLVKYIMEDTLRYIIEGSFENFAGEIETLTANCNVDLSYDWGDDLIKSEFPPPEDMTPPFSLELFMDHEGPKYITLLSRFPKLVTTLMENVLHVTSNLPDVVPQIMTNLLFGVNRHLSSVEITEPHIKKLKATALRSIRKGLLPVDKYAQKYKRYQGIWNLDQAKHLRAYEKENHTVADVRKAVESHTAELAKLEEEIPSQLDITCFRIITETVKQNLLKKKKQLVNGMLSQFAGKLKLAVLKIRDDYQDMERKLNTRSDDIEEVMELKIYVETVPSAVQSASEQMLKIMKDYEMFEKFSYAIPAEDFENKWNTAMMANKILKMAEEAVTWLDDDYDRLVKVQQSDLAALSDAVDSAFLSVGGLSAFVELERAIDVSAEVKKLWKQVQELVEQSNLLNKRQKVFDLPPAQNEALERLIHDLEPFKSLWFTAADWLRIQDVVFKETLDKIDVRAVNKLITEGGQVIRRCVRYFKGADNIQHIAEEVRHQIEEFKKVVPLIQTLKNQGMRQRHWEAISEICKFTVVAKGNQNFKALLDQGMGKYVDKIAEIGNLATNEFAIENKLEKMLRELNKLKIENIVDPASGVVIIVVIPKTATHTISELIKSTEELQQNPYRTPFDERLNTWEKKIKLTKENLDLWVENQQEWIELQEPFQAPDAATKMPPEHKMFVKMERIWRRLNRLVRDTPEEIGSDSTVRASLLQFSGLIKKVKAGLEEYMKPHGSSSDEDEPRLSKTSTIEGEKKTES